VSHREVGSRRGIVNPRNVRAMGRRGGSPGLTEGARERNFRATKSSVKGLPPAGTHLFGENNTMQKTILTVAALLATISLPSVAQDVSVDAGAAGGVSVETPSVGADVNASGAVSTETSASDTSAAAGANANAAANASTDDTYGSVVAAVNASGSVHLSTVTDEAKVTIVLLSSLKGEAATESAGLDAAIEANADAHAKLQQDAWANTAIKAKLEAGGYTSDDVVAVKTTADGSLLVYVDDVE
jgi:hypothetical protein